MSNTDITLNFQVEEEVTAQQALGLRFNVEESSNALYRCFGFGELPFGEGGFGGYCELFVRRGVGLRFNVEETSSYPYPVGNDQALGLQFAIQAAGSNALGIYANVEDTKDNALGLQFTTASALSTGLGLQWYTNVENTHALGIRFAVEETEQYPFTSLAPDTGLGLRFINLTPECVHTRAQFWVQRINDIESTIYGECWLELDYDRALPGERVGRCHVPMTEGVSNCRIQILSADQSTTLLSYTIPTADALGKFRLNNEATLLLQDGQQYTVVVTIDSTWNSDIVGHWPMWREVTLDRLVYLIDPNFGIVLEG